MPNATLEDVFSNKARWVGHLGVSSVGMALADELSAWQQNPNIASGLELARRIGEEGDVTLAKALLTYVRRELAAEAALLAAVGDLCVDLGLLREAQVAFILASKAQPTDAEPLKRLGQVLLYRGEAERAEKALARAVFLSASDAQARSWHRRAASLIPLQRRKGKRSVARSIAQATRVLSQSRAEVASPDAGRLLTLLSNLGVFEPEVGTRSAWEVPKLPSAIGLRTLCFALLVVGGLGGAAWGYMAISDDRREARFEETLKQVRQAFEDVSWQSSQRRRGLLRQAWSLGAESHEFARLWLEDEAVRALLTPGSARLSGAISHAYRVGLAESRRVFAIILQSALDGHLTRAVELMVEWDERLAERDAFYQLATAVTLERAGDSRSLARYRAAVQLAPELAVAQVYRVRLLLLTGDTRAFDDELEQRTAEYKSAAALRALAALSWAMRPAQSELSDAYAVSDAELRRLAPPFRVAYLLSKTAHHRAAGNPDRSATSLRAALQFATSPVELSRISSVAAAQKHQGLARRAAERAAAYQAP